MLPKRSLLFLILATIILSCSKKESGIQQVAIIPQPNDITIQDGYFMLNSKTGILFEDEFEVSARFLKTFVESGSSIELKSNDAIQFIKDNTVEGEESYQLKVTPDHIFIRANSDQGAFYAVQSLRQLLPSSFENGSNDSDIIKIPCVSIKDQPQFGYRGMHLDVGRHMFSVDFIKSYIDAIAMLKMNTFHWHLTEDQGWRIEIKKYPSLNTVAAYRDETLIGHYSDQPHQFDGKRYGGYYTQEEIKDIVSYAQERFVTIIPEIEMPGHSQAAIAAYPELGCTGELVKVATKWGVFEEIYCPTENTFTFLEDVLDEVIALFPSEYIHIGGDEAPKTRWKNSDVCQRIIKEKGLKDEHELQSYFITRIERYLNGKGKQIIGWDEILEGGLAPNASVMSWRGTSGAIEAAKQKHNVVMTPTSHCYFDYYQSDGENEPLAIGGYLPLEKVYDFNPIPEVLNEEEAKYIIGAQGNVWTEYMKTEDAVEYMVFPRILAISEVVWSENENKDYKGFVNRLEHFYERMDYLEINYANHLYEIQGQLVSTEEQINYELETLTEGKVIRYTTDGNNPSLESAIYDSPMPIDKSQTIKAAVFNDEGQLGSVFSQDVNYHKAVGARIHIDKEPHKAYSGSGAEGLINGISGSDTRYGDKEWLGFWGEDINIIIELKEETTINSIQMRFHNGNGQWIYAPKEISIRYETDKMAEYKTFIEKVDITEDVLASVKTDDTHVAKYIYIKVPNYGTIPEGKQGAGNKAWTFIDEIIIN